MKYLGYILAIGGVGAMLWYLNGYIEVLGWGGLIMILLIVAASNEPSATN